MSRRGAMQHGTSRAAVNLAVLAFLLAFLPADAQAYIDPGSGSLILQLVLSGIAGAAFMARRVIGRALRALGSTPRIESSGPDEGQSPDKRDQVG
jgi:hypothetical protein